MRAIALKDLESRVSEYVHLAQNGETVFVVEQDRVIAELVPPRRENAPWIKPASILGGVPPRIPIASLGDLLHELEADRGER